MKEKISNGLIVMAIIIFFAKLFGYTFSDEMVVCMLLAVIFL